MTDISAEQGIGDFLADFNQAREDLSNKKASLVEALGALVGSRIDILGYPDTAHMHTHISSSNGSVSRKIGVPVYRMFRMASDVGEDKPREASDCTLTRVDTKILTVEFDLPPEDERPAQCLSGYTFQLHNVIKIQQRQ